LQIHGVLRKDIPFEEKIKKFAEMGFSAIQFHDDDRVDNDKIQLQK